MTTLKRVLNQALVNVRLSAGLGVLLGLIIGLMQITIGHNGSGVAAKLGIILALVVVSTLALVVIYSAMNLLPNKGQMFNYGLIATAIYIGIRGANLVDCLAVIGAVTLGVVIDNVIANRRLDKVIDSANEALSRATQRVSDEQNNA